MLSTVEEAAPAPAKEEEKTMKVDATPVVVVEATPAHEPQEQEDSWIDKLPAWMMFRCWRAA